MCQMDSTANVKFVNFQTVLELKFHSFILISAWNVLDEYKASLLLGKIYCWAIYDIIYS